MLAGDMGMDVGTGRASSVEGTQQRCLRDRGTIIPNPLFLPNNCKESSDGDSCPFCHDLSFSSCSLWVYDPSCFLFYFVWMFFFIHGKLRVQFVLSWLSCLGPIYKLFHQDIKHFHNLQESGYRLFKGHFYLSSSLSFPSCKVNP